MAAFRFIKDGDHYRVEVGDVSLGRVIRGWRSTDSRVAGTRLIRRGKGAVVWYAEVPPEQWDRSRTLPAGQLQGEYGGGYRLEWRGQPWDTREEAALALTEWHA